VAARPHRRGPLALLLTALLAGCGPMVNFDPGDPAAFVQQPQTSVLEAADGSQLAELHAEQDRREIGLDGVADVFERAVVAVEDRRFYDHHGVDGGAIVRAALANVEAGEITQGGSTITQQYVKNTITGPTVTMERKLQEAVAAWQLEDRYEKDEILERYLNTVYFGKGAYGIRAASLRFFGVEPDELDLAQATLLAGVIASPSNYDPFLHPERALARREHVLDAMVDVGHLTREQADRTAAAPLRLAELEEDRSPAPYVVEEVKRLVRDDPDGWYGDLGASPDDRVNALFTGGYRVVTTIDPAAQSAAEAAVAEIVPEDAGPSAAVVLTDPATGAVRALVGGRDFWAEDDPTAKFNLATQARRQPGSSFKPIVLAAGLERGTTLDRVFPGGSCVAFDDLPDPWRPCNYDGTSYASMTLREATVRSVNTVYARLGMEVTPDALVGTARAMGMPEDLEAVPSISLGTEEVTPLDMAGAYGTFANAGRYAAPHLIERIERPDGEVVYRHGGDTTQVVTAATAYLVTQALSDVVERGTGVRAQIGRPQAGKTGTTQDSVDAWFVGYTPDLVGAVWVGFPEGRVPMRPPNTPEVVEGGRWPAEIWARTASAVLADVPPRDFEVPSMELVTVEVDTTRNCLPNPYTPPELIDDREYLRGSEPTEICTEPTGPAVLDVPDVLGLPLEVAQRLLADEGFPVEIRALASRRYPPGVVELQRPAPGGATNPADGNRVVLWVSQAITTRAIVPDVVEVSLDTAIRLLEEAGWVPVVQRACPVTGCTGDPTRVHAQDPPAGTTEREHSIVTIVVEPEGVVVSPSPTASPTPDEPSPSPTSPSPSPSTTSPSPAPPPSSPSPGPDGSPSPSPSPTADASPSPDDSPAGASPSPPG
jgi:penicillin-binding protein 1A